MKRKRVRLDFMVVPELLQTLAYVPSPVRVRIIDPQAIFLTGLLGESGKKLVKAGVEFYFTKKLADKLVVKGIAVEVEDDRMWGWYRGRYGKLIRPVSVESRQSVTGKVKRLLRGKYRNSVAPCSSVAAELKDELNSVGIAECDHLLAVLNMSKA